MDYNSIDLAGPVDYSSFCYFPSYLYHGVTVKAITDDVKKYRGANKTAMAQLPHCLDKALQDKMLCFKSMEVMRDSEHGTSSQMTVDKRSQFERNTLRYADATLSLAPASNALAAKPQLTYR